MHIVLIKKSWFYMKNIFFWYDTSHNICGEHVGLIERCTTVLKQYHNKWKYLKILNKPPFPGIHESLNCGAFPP